MAATAPRGARELQAGKEIAGQTRSKALSIAIAAAETVAQDTPAKKAARAAQAVMEAMEVSWF